MGGKIPGPAEEFFVMKCSFIYTYDGTLICSFLTWLLKYGFVLPTGVVHSTFLT